MIQYSNKTQTIKIDFIEPAIARLRMEDETGKNALSHAFVEGLNQNLNALSCHAEVKVIILTGLPSVFSAGADFETLKRLCTGQLKPADIVLPKTILDVPVPMIAAIEGHATGGGLALGLCADIVILAEESRYGCPFMNMGFTPGMGTTKLLEHFMSPAMAHEMQYTGAFKRGKELKEKAGFNYILPKNEVLPQATLIAQSIAEKPKEVLVILKRYLGLRRRKAYEETLTMESMMHDITFNSKDVLQYIEETYVR